MNFASTKERIIEFINYQGITVSVFLEKTGIKRGFLDGDKLKSTVSDIFIAKIIAIYPNINLEWLITGNGQMLKEETSSFKESNSEELLKYLDKKDKRVEELLIENGQLKQQIEDLKRDKPSIQHCTHVGSTELMKK